MPDSLPVGPYRILKTFDNHEVPWYILPFDERGICMAPLTRQDCLRQVAAEKPTDVFVFCHGWNNDWKHATEERYEKFIHGYEQLRREQPELCRRVQTLANRLVLAQRRFAIPQ